MRQHPKTDHFAWNLFSVIESLRHSGITTLRGIAQALNARGISAMLKHGMASVAQGVEAYETAYRERVVRQIKRKATALGLVVVEREAEAHQT